MSDYRTYTMTVVMTAPQDLNDTELMIYHALRSMDRADVTWVKLDFVMDECDNDAHAKEATVYVRPWTPAR